MSSFYIGVDVGTKSARAALVTEHGKLINTHVEPIAVFNPQTDHYEQSSAEIWSKVSLCVQSVSRDIPCKNDIKGIGFDATCSLVVLDKDFNSLPISMDQDPKKDVIMWMDHRAKNEASFINSNPHKVLEYTGGQISLEMQVPKLLWLKKNSPQIWKKACHFFDLPDFLTFKATGELSRSLCSLVCKWTYCCDKSAGKWDEDFFKSIGLEDLTRDNYSKIGEHVKYPGALCGYLTNKASEALGLAEGTPVGISMIDAHAGGLGLLSTKHESLKNSTYVGKLGLICGTSTCHMCVQENSTFIPGIWGPYYNAMIPKLWLHEAGQSATGSLIDHMIETHPASAQCPQGMNTYKWLEAHLEELKNRKNLPNLSYLSELFHVYPDFHGNRSPLADNTYRGMICGLTLDKSIDSLALLYLATLQAVTYGTKDIVNQLQLHGHKINTILACGGLTKSELFLKLHADVLGLPVIIPKEKESVLLGAAMLGAGAANPTLSLQEIGNQFGSEGTLVEADPSTKSFHDRKFKVFKKMQQNWSDYSTIMKT